ncbi:MAG: acyl-CoA thioesterase [Clostridiaceae bacterium]
MAKSITTLKVRYAETDQMAVVHHSKYYVYFETAREDFIDLVGIKYKDMEDQGVMMPILETNCKYYEGAKYADVLKIETILEEITPIKVIFQYNITREADNKLIAKGKTVQAFVDKENFKIVNLKKRYPEIWAKFEALRE